MQKMLSPLPWTGCVPDPGPDPLHLAMEPAASADATITMVDSASRTVDVPYPVQSVVVLWSNPAKELRALGVVDRIVGMDQSTKDEVDKGKLPELADVAVVGTQEEPNYEKIAELKPDVVIALSAGYPPEPAEIQKKLEPFNIPVVGLDFYRTEVWFDEMEKLGKMLGKEAEAKEYTDFLARLLRTDQ